MQKTYFHNFKSKIESKEKKKLAQSSKVDTKYVVDINILLNRVKIEERNETKRKIIFFSFITLALTLFGTFITIIK
ncbi:hypothetical protein OAT04_03745 [Candidatus Pelagibacter sp.]|jgi:hypothetical protein|nr:hypothetical protein [Candidatus Pelagibacter sp.]MDC1139958.1 hypothetical protein [Candidatus Pelagibacter sp.]